MVAPCTHTDTGACECTHTTSTETVSAFSFFRLMCKKNRQLSDKECKYITLSHYRAIEQLKRMDFTLIDN